MQSQSSEHKQPATRSYGRADRVLLCLLASSLLVNAYLAQRVRNTAREGGSRWSRNVADIGTPIPAVRVKDRTGKPVDIRLDDGKPTVLYVLSPSCPWCIRNVANVRTLARERSDKYRFVGISLHTQGPPAQLDESDIGFPVFSEPSPVARRLLKLGPTPVTMVISPQGKVTKTWFGAYSGSVAEEVSQFFGVELPGLTGTANRSKSSGCRRSSTELN